MNNPASNPNLSRTETYKSQTVKANLVTTLTMTTCPSGTAAASPRLAFKTSAWFMKKTCSLLAFECTTLVRLRMGRPQDEDDDDFAEDGGFF